MKSKTQYFMPCLFLFAFVFADCKDPAFPSASTPKLSTLPNGKILFVHHSQIATIEPNEPFLFAPFPHANLASSPLLLPDGEHVLVVKNERSVHLWNASNQEPPLQMDRSPKTTLSAALSEDGSTLTSIGPDYMVRFWRTEDGKLDSYVSLDTSYFDFWGRFFPNNLARPLLRATFSPHGKYLVTFSEGTEEALLWNPKTGALLSTLVEHKAPIKSLVFSQDEQWAVSYSEERTLVWDYQSSNAKLHSPILLDAALTHVQAASFLPNGRLLIANMQGSDSFVQVWDIKQRSLISTIPLGNIVPASLALTLDEKILFVSTEDGTISIFRVSF